MLAENAWEMILRGIKGKIEIQTVPTVNRLPKWFAVLLIQDGNAISIEKALHNKPSCSISVERSLTFRDFEKVFPYFLQRKRGDSVSKLVTSRSYHQSYIYALISHFVSFDKE